MNETATRKLRVIAGIGLAIGLGVIGAMLVPPYVQNAKFQSYVDDAVARNAPPAVIKADIVNRAAQMGLPVREGDVRMTPSRENGLRVDIIYVNRVDLKLYTVDLHFHPSAER